MIKPFGGSSENCFLSIQDNVFTWHKKLGHVHFSLLEKLSKFNMIKRLPKINIKEDIKCDACLKNKIVLAPHKKKNLISTKRPLELLHVDLFGPPRMVSLGKSKYGMIIVDDYSIYTWILFLRNKGDAIDAFKKFAK